jgi:hypothetical protein
MGDYLRPGKQQEGEGKKERERMKGMDMVVGSQGGGREINECYSETKDNQSWGMLPGDKRRVTLP